MTNEEALETLKYEIEEECHCGYIEEEMKLAISALEKQILKKPLPENKYYGNGKCPNCNAVFLDKSTKYCGNCGQALDWSE